MRVVTEATLREVMDDPVLRHQAYSALDSCVLPEVFGVLEPRLDADTQRIYQFEHACQQPAIAMALRGVRIDAGRRTETIKGLEEDELEAGREAAEAAGSAWDKLEKHVGSCGGNRSHLWPRVVDPGVGVVCKRCGESRFRLAPLNCNSPQQVAALLYDKLGVRKRRDRQTGLPTTDKEALESIYGEHVSLGVEGRELSARIAKCCDAIKRARQARKQLGYARAPLSVTGRMHSSFHVGAAETGRWSTSEAPDWTGWSIHQIAERLRHMVVADPGLELFYADLEKAESHIVAYDAQDEAYIEAHADPDLHTYVCRLMWPDLPWSMGRFTTDCGAAKHASDGSCCDRGLAEQPPGFDPHHSKRDYGKRFQHGGNMGRTPIGVARQIHISEAQAKDAYGRMYGGWGHPGAFPRIKVRHEEIAVELARTGMTLSCLRRPRQFQGRTRGVGAADTLREALGQLEQSPIADLLNLALLRIWLEMDTRLNIWDAPAPSQPNRVWLLAQVHDAILGLYRPGDVGALKRVKELMSIPLGIHGRTFTIPVEISVGPSWSKREMRKAKL